MMKKFLILILVYTSVFISGCVYRIDVQQGNVVTDEMLAKLELGMPKRTVRFALGEPLLHDSFHPDRWDYFYSLTTGSWQRTTERKTITLLFDEGGLLTRVEGADIELQPGKVKPQPEQPLQQPDGRPLL